MGEISGIAWCDGTFNPWWGCTKVSEGCKFCYAESLSNRFSNNIWGKDAERRFFGDKHWNEPVRWNKKAKESGKAMRVFSGSMCDIMEDRDDLIEHRKRLFKLIEDTEALTWLLLTKRPENYMKFLPESWLGNPRKNVWLMTSVENQKNIGRADILATVPAYIRGLSIEPLIEELDVSNIPENIAWYIVGGESGKNARSFNIEWARKIKGDVEKKNRYFFMKQTGSNVVGRKVSSRAGEDMSEWDEDIRVRSLPLAV